MTSKLNSTDNLLIEGDTNLHLFVNLSFRSLTFDGTPYIPYMKRLASLVWSRQPGIRELKQATFLSPERKWTFRLLGH